jgi:protein-tyrosine phosphatase
MVQHLKEDNRVGLKCAVFVAVFGPEQMLLPAYSGYFVSLNPGPQVLEAAEQSQVLALVLQILCALILIVLVLLLSLCLLQRYTKQVAEAQGVEMTLTNSFRYFTVIISTTEV